MTLTDRMWDARVDRWDILKLIAGCEVGKMENHTLQTLCREL